MPRMRWRFVETATDLLDRNPEVAVVLADISVGRFQELGATERHPHRLVNVGIREQLQIGVAAGLAKEGFRPYVHTYAPFLVERPFEQVKLDLSHQELGAVLVSAGASYDATGEGRTHQAPEDVAVMATLPGWEIVLPGHADEAEAVLRREAERTGRVYVRLARDENDAPHMEGLDGLTTVRRGSADAVVVVAVGPMLDPVLAATGDLDATVLYTATVRPFDGPALAAAVDQASPRVVLVEPSLEGTSSAPVSRALESRPHRLLAVGVPRKEHRRYGTRQEHDRAHGLDAAGIRRRMASFLA